MSHEYKEQVEKLIRFLGGTANIRSVSNCMTRLRTEVLDPARVDEAGLRSLEDVMGLVHDREGFYEIVVGPGKSRKYADQCHAMGLASAPDAPAEQEQGWKQNKQQLQRNQKESWLRTGLKMIGEIFVPLLPGIIAAGLCSGFAALIAQTIPGYDASRVWSIAYRLLTLILASFMTYLTAWAGYRAAERFGATPILGGMLGMITSLDGINQISRILGLYNEQTPLHSVLMAGKGGVLSVIIGVALLAAVEKRIRSKMPESIDIIFTPLLSLLICVAPYILVIMPILGYVSSGIVFVFTHLCMSSSLLVRLLAGYVSSALFLPLVATGMHHGLVALYSLQLQEIGYVTLYPALAMAGAGQVGCAAALWIKARKVGNRKLCSIISGALPVGVLGVGEPLIYGVTLPLGKPFLLAGLGAGFGGALVMALQVASTTWGPSGVLGVFVMTAGPQGAVGSALCYLAGLAVAYTCSFLITALFFNKHELEPAQPCPPSSEPADQTAGSSQEAPRADSPASSSGAHRTVRHGETILLGMPDTRFDYTLTDPSGIHARPAGRLAQLVKDYDCEVTILANGRRASAASLLELMNLGAGPGTVLTVTASGREASRALLAVKAFFRQNQL